MVLLGPRCILQMGLIRLHALVRSYPLTSNLFLWKKSQLRLLTISVMSLSSISYECGDSFLLLLSELLTTLVAFFLTKGELT